MEKKVEKQELESLQKLNKEFNRIKLQLGDLSLQKHSLCLQVEGIKGEFQVLEKDLMEKYGVDSVINLETGEVKEKEKEPVDGKDK